MTARRFIVHIDELILDAPAGADPAHLEAALRSELLDAFAGGVLPPAFTRDAAVLHATRAHDPAGPWSGVGASVVQAAPPRRQP